MARFAIKTPTQHTQWTDMADVWREADQIDLFESAWNFDHFYPIHGNPTGPCMEAWVTLTALAQMTSRIRIGCMVNGMHFRHPAVTANMAASLDIVANGRLNLGLGAGWFELEAQSLGFELGTIRQRMDRFDEGVEVVARLLSQDTTTFSGAFYQLDEARCEPKGQQEPHPPIVIGGQGERRTLRTVAKWAQMWDALMIGPEDWTRKREVLLNHCSEVGRDPAEITCSAHVPWSKEAGPAEPVERAAQLIAAGIDVVVFTMRAPYDVSMLEPMTAELAQLA